MLNDKGRKIVREKRGNGPEETTNHLYNLEDNEVQGFDNNWHGVNRETKFLDNAQKAIRGYQGNQGRQQNRQLGYGGPRRDTAERMEIEDPRRRNGSRGGVDSGY